MDGRSVMAANLFLFWLRGLSIGVLISMAYSAANNAEWLVLSILAAMVLLGAYGHWDLAIREVRATKKGGEDQP